MTYKISYINGKLISLAIAIIVFTISLIVSISGIISVLIQGKDLLFGIYMAILILPFNSIISYIFCRLFFVILNFLLRKSNKMIIKLDKISD